MGIVGWFLLIIIALFVIEFYIVIKVRKHYREKRWRERWELEQKWKKEYEENNK